MESQRLIYFLKSVPGCIPVPVLENKQYSIINRFKALITPVQFICACAHRFKVSLAPKTQQKLKEFIRAERYCGAPD